MTAIYLVCLISDTICAKVNCLLIQLKLIPVCCSSSNIQIVLNLQAKKFVESLPQTLKVDVSKEESEKLKAAIEAVGAVVEIE